MKLGISSVSSLVENYFHSLHNQRTGKRNKKALCVQMVLPICLGVVFGLFGPTIKDYSDVIVGISIVAAFLCAMATLLFQTRNNLRVSQKRGEEPFITSKDLELIDQLFAAVMWAILFGLNTALMMIMIGWLSSVWLDPSISHILSGVIVAAVFHFVFVIGLVLKRLNRIYDLIAKQRR